MTNEADTDRSPPRRAARAPACMLCGTGLNGTAPALAVRREGLAGTGALHEGPASTDDGAIVRLCGDHPEVARLLRRLFEALGDAEQRLRGHLYVELDLLAFALEMESSEAVERGDEDAAARAQQTRLGIRLAQRLVGGVPAPETDRRLTRWRKAYEAKFPGG